MKKRKQIHNSSFTLLTNLHKNTEKNISNLLTGFLDEVFFWKLLHLNRKIIRKTIGTIRN